MRRREFISLIGGAAVACELILQAKARDRGELPLIGFLSLSNPSTFHDGLAQGLHDLGYVEGQSIYIERRFGGGKPDRLPELAKELVQLQPKVIVAGGSPSTLAVSRTTNTIPVVMVGVVGPPWAVPIQGLARPGGHITGLVNMNPDLSAKRLQLLQEMIPSVRRVSVLVDLSYPVSPELLTQTRAAAQALGLMLNVFDMRGDADYQSALSALVRETPDPVLVLPTSLFLAHRQELAEFFLEHRIPTVFGFRDHVEVGGLMSYSTGLYAQFYRAAAYVDKILKGANPADLPVEQPTKFELVINLKTARTIGLAVPPVLLARADEVIE